MFIFISDLSLFVNMQDLDRFYNYSLRFLSYRPRSEKEVRDHLIRKKAESLIIDRIIIKLKEQKFINDEEFAKWWIEKRTTFKPRSLRLIKIELKQKGISNEIIESGIRNQESGIENDLQRAKKLLERKIEKVKGLSKQKIYQKLGSYLSRRGFDWETIKQSIDESFDNGV